MVTLKDIAAEAGVSITTVSNVVHNRKSRVSEKKVAKIWEIIEREHYVPSMSARSLANDQSAIIAMVTYIEQRTREAGYYLMLRSAESVAALEGLIHSWRLSGLIMTGLFQDSFFDAVAKLGIPVVLIDSYVDDPNICCVGLEDEKGGYLATKHLLENGHRRIACIQGTPHSMPVRDRVRGFGDTLRAHGLGDRIVVTGEDFSVQNGYLETKLALAQAERPTAIFALSNLILLGVVKAVHESGLRIPDDISVVSFDDNMLFNYLDPAITCIGQPTDEIGTLAVKLLIRAIREPGAAPSHLHLPPSLIIRRSVRNLLL